MKHYILVKYQDSVQNRQQLLEDIRALFAPASQMEGISDVSLRPAILFSEKRFDLMICLHMEQEALAAFDQSEIHRLWKEDFGQYIAQKVIFDCE